VGDQNIEHREKDEDIRQKIEKRPCFFRPPAVYDIHPDMQPVFQTVCSPENEKRPVLHPGHLVRPSGRSLKKVSHDHIVSHKTNKGQADPGKYPAGPLADRIDAVDEFLNSGHGNLSFW
jgi:hypothetical protein